jgi:hypothetical protein
MTQGPQKVSDGSLTAATGFAEREQALAMTARLPARPGATLGADKSYDTRDCVGLHPLRSST